MQATAYRTTKPAKTAACLTPQQQRRYDRLPEAVEAVHHPMFDDPAAWEQLFGPDAPDVDVPRWTLFPEVPEAAPQRSGERSSLSKGEETHLFLRFNYARHRLAELMARQQKRSCRTRASSMIEWYDRVRSTRGDLVSANMRLVVAMARRCRIPNVDFAELVSEGSMALLRAIEKFDVSRGFKFSTYACRVILKAFHRMATKTARHYQYFGVAFDPHMEPSDHDVLRHEREREVAVDDLREILDRNRAQLTELERSIVAERFALDGRDKKKTLAQVSAMVGLSNERVRQIQRSALLKIREAFDEHFSAA